MIGQYCCHPLFIKTFIYTERAEILTQMGRGKHHLGDFLPPDELEKFLETLQALKEGRTPDFSDYQKFKIQADNIGKVSNIPERTIE